MALLCFDARVNLLIGKVYNLLNNGNCNGLPRVNICDKFMAHARSSTQHH
ncbi:8071_t:CDS:2 [Gigaspora margarita]|uniref:8071_t:CDS:1 n=1 Tax=Gigaspora margarita TaxID=4874 RepID=A0ABM8W275_GIGMA|nr:8071_t:CDS:2 [Gigaspora margarita]